MYQELVNAVKSQKKLGDADFKKYLVKLQGDVKILREFYQKKTVGPIDYTDDDRQAAYLLTYFPHYYQTSRKVISSALAHFGHTVASLSPGPFVCFCGGPAPEHYALMCGLQDDTSRSAQQESYIVDHNDWAFARAVVRRVHKSTRVPLGRSVTNWTFDVLCKENLDKRRRAAVLSNASLITFQNFANEVPAAQMAKLLEVIRHIRSLMKEGAIIVFHELPTYEQGNKIFEALQQIFPNNNFPDKYKNILSEYETPPLIISQYLLTGDARAFLNPKRDLHGRVFSAVKVV